MDRISIANKVKQQILKYIKENIRDRFPQIVDDMLLKHGTVFYMNGYDGSEFDFYVNNRTCEFVSFYRKPTRRFFDVYVSCNGIIRGRVYLDVGDDVGIAVEQGYVNPWELAEFVRVMQIFADDLGKWDYNIEEIVFKTRK